MQLQAIVRKNQYQDSVRLMQISRQASETPDVRKVLALLGTDSNKKVLADLGLMQAAIAAATANDLVICIEAATEAAVAAALDTVDACLKAVATAASAAEAKPRSLEEAARRLPGANFAMISLPGQMAKLDVADALDQGLHVMLFSDNIPLADEAALKARAVGKGLLLMGPDCGTAIINGVALALANVVRRGDIGLAAASGTGIQEVTCLIDRFGGGVSHAIGVGGRDLRREVGGAMMCQAIRTLAQDPATKKLVILSKPGAPEVMAKVLAEARASGLEVIACLLGADGATADSDGMACVSTLEEAAFRALGLAVPPPEIPEGLRRHVAGQSPRRRFLRGLYSGGTLCYETLFVLRDVLDIESNVAIRPELKLPYPVKGQAHCCVDLGEDEFTRGRPHPIIDLGLRLERLAEDMADPTVKVILLDLVLGYGAHRNPAAALAAALDHARRGQADGGPAVLAHVCGTDADPQQRRTQEELLSKAGAYLFATNAQAARAAQAIVAGTL
ncbi:MAG: acyl-CoA synthetase FdrA [Solidesulfovibrio sp. DCME]|uniref:acyl-CoA synthetase FdrA n=1 Tax=Solidesulfovibrio sp. DCME TaxID=3447380 RepID=UPI003D1415B6